MLRWRAEMMPAVTVPPSRRDCRQRPPNRLPASFHYRRTSPLERLVRLDPEHRDIDLFILAKHFGFNFWPSVKMTVTSLASATT